MAVPVRLADPAAAALLRPGDRVDVLAAPTGPDGPPAAVRRRGRGPGARGARRATAAAEGALVVLAATPSSAARLASAEVSSRLSVVVRP